jgi:methionyl-tRNA synthetase
MWQGMLLSAGLPLTRHIVIDGFITSGGQKMSKSLGNVISPFDIIEEYRSVARYPEDVLRFTLLREIPSFEDGDLTRESIRESYAANLQNGIGNLTSRVMRMATMHLPAPVTCAHIANLGEVYAALEKFDTKKAMDEVLRLAQDMDRKIQLTEPFKVVKIDPKKGRALIEELVRDLHTFATALEIFLPRTARKILSLIAEHNMPEAPLFNRLP